jgi:site-specific recombinase XerD
MDRLRKMAIEKRHLNKTIRALGDPAVNRLNKRMIAQHRSQRLEDGISAATINRDIYRLSGMFSTLIKLEEFRKENPCKGLEPLKEAASYDLSRQIRDQQIAGYSDRRRSTRSTAMPQHWRTLG